MPPPPVLPPPVMEPPKVLPPPVMEAPKVLPPPPVKQQTLFNEDNDEPPKAPVRATAVKEDYEMSEDGFTRVVHKPLDLRPSEVSAPATAGSSVKDIAQTMKMPIMGLGGMNYTQMKAEKKRKEDEERARRA